MENTDGKNVKRFMCSSNDWDYKALCASICDYSESCERNRTEQNRRRKKYFNFTTLHLSLFVGHNS